MRSDERTLNEQSYDLFGQMLLEKIATDVQKEIEEDQDDGEIEEMDAFFARFDSKNLKTIEAYFKKKKRKDVLTKTLPRIGQVAAIFIAIIALAGTVAVAASRTVRVRVMQLLYSIEEQYTTISLEEDAEASFDIPSDWTGNSFPSFIPNGMVVSEIISTSDSRIIHYEDDETHEKKLVFIEANTTISNIDTENAIVKPVLVREHDGVMATKEGFLAIVWSDKTNYFIVMLYEEMPDLAMKIAESVMRIK